MRARRLGWRVVVAGAIALFTSLPSLQGYCAMPPPTSEEAVGHGCCTGGIAAAAPTCCDTSDDLGQAVLTGKLAIHSGAPTAVLESTPLMTRAAAHRTVRTALSLHGPPAILRI